MKITCLREKTLKKVEAFLDNADKMQLPASMEINYANKQAKIKVSWYETIKEEK